MLPKYDGTKLDELHTRIMQLQNKLRAEELAFSDEISTLRYTLNCLKGNALEQAIHKVNEETRHIDIKSLNTFLDTLR